RVKNGFVIKTENGTKLKADKILVTAPSLLLARLFPKLPPAYKKRIESIKYLSAQVLIMRLKKKFMDQTYWLSMSDSASPFLAAVEHTNYMDPKHYNGEHIVYVGNYLSANHPYLSMSTKELIEVFEPQLSKINKNYKKHLIDMHLFSVPGAQPIVDKGYAKRIPKMITPIKDVYIANMEMVYPWDRGTNYAIEYGEKVAEIMASDLS
ncbi:MAG: FAD-dependent oxidoreductase, partial [Patescibacteria group bacterium]